MTTNATPTLQDACADTWDVIVVGAGPAGAVAARALARHRRRVLLVDKRAFPRAKVCGSCLSQHALMVLQRIGLGELPDRLEGSPYDRFRLWSHGVAATLRLPTGIAVTRSALDNGLVEAAVLEGAAFLPGTQANLGLETTDKRNVRLKRAHEEVVVGATIVIVADGGGGSLLAQSPQIEYRTWRGSRIGAGAVLTDETSSYQPGAIYMGVARHGYVGLVRAEQNQLNVGAALDPDFVRRGGGLAAAVDGIVRESGLPRSGSIGTASWRGTAPLTRRPTQVSCHRLFAIGDAAGYAEPFTGEGMAWAMTSAMMVVPFALAALDQWRPEIAANWTAAHRSAIRGRQNSCFRLAALLRHPWLVRGAISALARFPNLAQPLIRRMNSVPKELSA